MWCVGCCVWYLWDVEGNWEVGIYWMGVVGDFGGWFGREVVGVCDVWMDVGFFDEWVCSCFVDGWEGREIGVELEVEGIFELGR